MIFLLTRERYSKNAGGEEHAFALGEFNYAGKRICGIGFFTERCDA